MELWRLKGRVGRDVLGGARCVRAGKGRERKVGWMREKFECKSDLDSQANLFERFVRAADGALMPKIALGLDAK